jgi:uncharacterized protein with PQ loop repeat
MEEDTSAVIVGVLMAVFGLAGLFLAANARDLEMSIFGFSLVALACFFIFGLIRRHYDRIESLRVTAEVSPTTVSSTENKQL